MFFFFQPMVDDSELFISNSSYIVTNTVRKKWTRTRTRGKEREQTKYLRRKKNEIVRARTQRKKEEEEQEQTDVSVLTQAYGALLG